MISSYFSHVHSCHSYHCCLWSLDNEGNDNFVSEDSVLQNRGLTAVFGDLIIKGMIISFLNFTESWPQCCLWSLDNKWNDNFISEDSVLQNCGLTAVFGHLIINGMIISLLKTQFYRIVASDLSACFSCSLRH
jgi:hypothetical protein